MHMQMVDRFSGVTPTIDDNAIAIRNAGFCRNLLGDEKKMAQELGVPGIRRVEIVHVLARDHEDVRRRLGRNVMECHGAIVLMRELRGNLPRRNVTENARRHGSSFPAHARNQ
jgi:hypothetical protein